MGCQYINISGSLSWMCLLIGVFVFHVISGSETLDTTWLEVQYEGSNDTQGDAKSMVNTTKFEQLREANNQSQSVHTLMEAQNPTLFPFNLPTSVIIPSTKDTRLKGPVGPRVTTPKPSIVISDEDKKVRKDWGGNCTTYHWEICSNQTLFGKDVYDPETKLKVASQLQCKDPDLFPPVCLFNGWTVSRCHLLCMSKECNKELKTHYDKYVSKDGFC